MAIAHAPPIGKMFAAATLLLCSFLLLLLLSASRCSSLYATLGFAHSVAWHATRGHARWHVACQAAVKRDVAARRWAARRS